MLAQFSILCAQIGVSGQKWDHKWEFWHNRSHKMLNCWHNWAFVATSNAHHKLAFCWHKLALWPYFSILCAHICFFGRHIILGFEDTTNLCICNTTLWPQIITLEKLSIYLFFECHVQGSVLRCPFCFVLVEVIVFVSSCFNKVFFFFSFNKKSILLWCH